ncbi:MAG: O-antigen ligase family protein [Sphingomonas sp.]
MPSVIKHAGALAQGRSKYLISCGIFVLVLTLTGGASRADEFAQTIVRASAIAIIALAFLQRSRRLSAGHDRFIIILMGAITSLIGLQLVPLPPGVWLAMPGHDLYGVAAKVAQIAEPWRPINLVPDQGWDSLLSMLPIWATLVIVLSLRAEERRITINALVLISVLSATVGIMQMLLGRDSALYYYKVSSVGTPTGIFANRNHQAVMLAAGMAASSVWGSRTSQSRPHFNGIKVGLSLSAFAALLLVLVATGSRAGLLLGGIATLAALYFWRRGIIASGLLSGRTKHIFFPAAAAVAVGVAAIALAFNRGQSFERLASMGAGDDTRLGALKPLWLMLKTFFPFGSGVGSFDPVYRRFERLDDLQVEYLNQAHNDLAQVVIEAGLLGGLLAGAYVCWWVYQTFRIWRSPSDHPDQLMARLGTIVTGMILLLSLTDYPLRTPLLASLAILASVWMSPQRHKSNVTAANL